MKKTTRTISVILSICFIFSMTLYRNAYAANSNNDTLTIGVDVTYGQTDARNMLKLINDFRTATDGTAWQWNEDNSTKTSFNTNSSNTLGKLTYDYELEKVAMQRAAEIAVIYSHTRPDGSGCFTAYPDEIVFWSKGENIAAGYPSYSMEDVFRAWQETDKDYSGQGHRRNMLGSKFNIVGIGHVKYNGAEYWVQEFGKVDSPVTSSTAAADSAARVSVNISSSLISTDSLSCDTSSVTTNKGESVSVPELSAKCSVSGNWPFGSCTVYPEASWTTSNSSVVTVSGGKLTGVSAGTADVTASFGGKNVKVSVTVNGSGSAVLAGDVTGDNIVDTKDLTRLMKYCAGMDVKVNLQAADMNGDNSVNAKDMTALMKMVSGTV